MMSEMNLLTFLENVSCASVGIMMDLCSGGNLMDLFLNTTFSFALAPFSMWFLNVSGLLC